MTDRVKSRSTTEAKALVKEAIGKLIGDEKLAAEGRSQQKLPKSDVNPKAGAQT